MSFRTVSIIAIVGISAVVVYRLSGDERVQKPARDMVQLVGQVRAQATSEDTATGGPRVLRGPAQVIDGATLEFLDPAVTVNLAGIDVCGPSQPAFFQGTPWPCGAVATAWLVSLTLGQTVECQILDRRYDGERIGRCGVNGADIAAEAIVNGHAVVADAAAGVPETTYRELEERARAEKKGLWSSTFTRPQQWRQDNARDRQSGVRKVVPGDTTVDLSPGEIETDEQ